MKLEYEISTVLGALSGFGCFLLSHFCCEQFAINVCDKVIERINNSVSFPHFIPESSTIARNEPNFTEIVNFGTLAIEEGFEVTIDENRILFRDKSSDYPTVRRLEKSDFSGNRASFISFPHFPHYSETMNFCVTANTTTDYSAQKGN